MNTLLLKITWNPSEILFSIGSIQIRYYSLMFVIAFLLGLKIMEKIFKNDNEPLKIVEPLFMYNVIAILLGARLGDVFFYSWDYYHNHLSEILLPIRANADAAIFGVIKGYEFTGFRGLASHGAAIGVIVGMVLFAIQMKKKHNWYKSPLWILDRVVIPVAIGGAFVRLGNLMNSEIIGKVTNSIFGFRFVRNDIKSWEAVKITGLNNVNAAYKAIEHKSKFKAVLAEIPYRFPTQIFESLGYVVLFALLWYVYWKTDKKQKQGFIFGLFMTYLWIFRFFIEFLKEPQVAGREDFVSFLNTGQLLSVPLTLVGLYFMFRSSQKTM